VDEEDVLRLRVNRATRRFRYNHKGLMELQTQATPATATRNWEQYLRGAIFLFFLLFVILLPWSIKGARYAWMAAFWLWIADVLIERKRLRPQPLAAPMLAYILLSGLSCAFSYEPYLSWPHMKLVCWTALIAALFAQNLTRLSQIRMLIVLLLLSAAAVGAFTAWQYARGVGLRVVDVVYRSPLHLAGLRPDDIIATVNDRAVHSQADLIKAASAMPPNATVRIRFLRGSPVRRKDTFAHAADFLAGGALSSTIKLTKATPLRAEGTLGHYGKLAEVMAPIACLAWALMLGTAARQRWQQLSFAVIFLVITATVFATQSRSALTGLLTGCMIAMLLMSPRRARVWLVSGLLVVALGAAFWIQHTRGLKWVDRRDPGTLYRVQMWQDGVRLALRHPLFGVGMDSIQNHWPEWNLRGFARYQQFWNFHSDIVQLAVERGLPTLAAWLWFVVAYFVYLVRLLPRLRSRTPFGWAVLTGIFTGLAAFLISSLVESSLGDDTLVMLLFLCVGVAIAIGRMLDDPGALDVLS
jgi:hypothetical protein